MLATILLVLGGFTLVVVRAFRRGAAGGERFAPEGKLRWTDEDS
ncbi:MAG TPA: hypothetical protein VF530_06015 [Planctomycetota bacterium]